MDILSAALLLNIYDVHKLQIVQTPPRMKTIFYKPPSIPNKKRHNIKITRKSTNYQPRTLRF
jgi:hypothetical protein